MDKRELEKHRIRRHMLPQVMIELAAANITAASAIERAEEFVSLTFGAIWPDIEAVDEAIEEQLRERRDYNANGPRLVKVQE